MASFGDTQLYFVPYLLKKPRQIFSKTKTGKKKAVPRSRQTVRPKGNGINEGLGCGKMPIF